MTYRADSLTPRTPAIVALVVALTLVVWVHTAYAAVWVSEVAWMGTESSATDEWIELTNDESTEVDLSGWVLEAVDGTPHIALTGVIAPGAHVVLERTDDQTVAGVPAFLVYTGALSNEGEVLVLRDAQGREVDRVDGSDSWAIGGDRITKATLQRVQHAGSWITAPPTPGTLPAASSATPTQETSPESTSDSSATTTPQGGAADDTADPASSSGSTSGGMAKINPIPHALMPLPWQVVIDAASETLVGTPLQLTARVWHAERRERVARGWWARWSFGDGGEGVGERVEHTYYYPGTYVVVVTVGRHGSPETVTARHTVHVAAARLALVAVAPTHITLRNLASNPVDIGGMEMVARGHRFVFPVPTIILGGQSAVFPTEITGLSPHAPEEVVVRYPSGRTVNLVEMSSGASSDSSTTPRALPSSSPALGSVAGRSLHPQPRLVRATQLSEISSLPVSKKENAVDNRAAHRNQEEHDGAPHESAPAVRASAAAVGLTDAPEGPREGVGRWMLLAILLGGNGIVAWWLGGAVSSGTGGGVRPTGERDRDEAVQAARERASRFELFP